MSVCEHCACAEEEELKLVEKCSRLLSASSAVSHLFSKHPIVPPHTHQKVNLQHQIHTSLIPPAE